MIYISIALVAVGYGPVSAEELSVIALSEHPDINIRGKVRFLH